jgi:hypothetical protein
VAAEAQQQLWWARLLKRTPGDDVNARFFTQQVLATHGEWLSTEQALVAASQRPERPQI